jgi:hypothetical protein
VAIPAQVRQVEQVPRRAVVSVLDEQPCDGVDIVPADVVDQRVRRIGRGVAERRLVAARQGAFVAASHVLLVLQEVAKRYADVVTDNGVDLVLTGLVPRDRRGRRGRVYQKGFGGGGPVKNTASAKSAPDETCCILYVIIV